VAGTCVAADYPEKAVRFIVPFPPGGGTDALARILASKLTESWGQPLIIDNRGGAQGSLGTALGAKAVPDGYTMLLGHSGSLVINPHMYDNPGYDTLKDFAPVTRGTEMPFILVLHPRETASRQAHLCINLCWPAVDGRNVSPGHRRGHGARAVQGRGACRDRSARRTRGHHVLGAQFSGAAHPFG
jgi:hypothetical protein